jgi:hypothetical protein
MISDELGPPQTRTRARPALETNVVSTVLLGSSRYTLLLGVIGVFGVVTGGGSKAASGSVFTASKFRG